MARNFTCSAGCQAIDGASTVTPSTPRHLSNRLNAVAQQAIARIAGRWAWRFNTLAGSAESYIQHDTASQTGGCRRFYVRFNGSLPTTDCILTNIITADGSNSPRIRFRVATGDIIAAITNATAGATAQVVVANTWYRIDYKWDCSTGTRRSAMKVNGVDKGEATVVTPASSSTRWRMGGGAATGAPCVADICITDIVCDDAAASYPLPDGQGIALQMQADGAHSFGATGRFRYNDTSDIAAAATDVHTYLNHGLGSISSFLATAAGLLAGEFLEVKVGSGMPAFDSINGVEVAAAMHAPNTTSNKLSIRGRDNGADFTVLDDGDFSNTGIGTYSQQLGTTRPNGGAWTVNSIHNLAFRLGSSWTSPDVSPAGYFDGLVVEVDYVPASGIVITVTDALRITTGIPEGLEGFDRQVHINTEDLVRFSTRVGLPTVKTVNPDTGGADPAIDPSFTAESVMTAARDRHASFDKQRHPDAILVRRLDQLQRQFLIEALQRNSSFMAKSFTVPLPLETFSAGFPLTFAYHRIVGADVLFTDLVRAELTFIEYGQRLSPAPIFSAWIHGGILHLRGFPADWTEVTSIEISYVPTVARITQLRSVFQLPRSAEAAFVDNLAAFMASRGHNDPQLPEIDVGELNRSAAESEEVFYQEIAGRRKTGAKYVKDVL